MVARKKPAGCCVPAWVKPLPDKQLQRLATTARALADPTRIEVLRLLARQDGPVCACDIVEHFRLSQPTVSHHLKILRESKLVTATRQGLWMSYSIDADGARALEELTALLDT